MDKVFTSASAAVADIADGSRIAVGGFGLVGVPFTLIDALLTQGASELEIVSNNLGVDNRGLGLLLAAGRIRRAVSSYIGNNREFMRQYLAGVLEVELTPQGTLAERLRAGGAGIGAFFTPSGVGTMVAEGGLPWRYDDEGRVILVSPPKEVRTFHGQRMILEESLPCDVALVHAAVADRHGNVRFHAAARNFNPAAAMAGRVTIVEAEEVVEPGVLDPDDIHLAGIYVHRVVALSPAQAADKPVEIRTIRPADEEN